MRFDLTLQKWYYTINLNTAFYVQNMIKFSSIITYYTYLYFKVYDKSSQRLFFMIHPGALWFLRQYPQRNKPPSPDCLHVGIPSKQSFSVGFYTGGKLNALDLYVVTWKELHDTLIEEAHCKLIYRRWSHFKIKSALKNSG